MRLTILLVCITGLSCLSFAQTSVPAAVPSAQPEPVRQVLPSQPLGAGDLVNISVYSAPELSGQVRVTSDGKIRLPLAKNPVTANGMPDDLARSIVSELKAEELLVDPLVTVTVTEYGSRPVSITGAVNHPVTFQAYGHMTLLTALAKADGLTLQAGPLLLVNLPANQYRSSEVRRIPIASLMSGADPALNLELQGGEEIRVPEAEKVYVLGNVRKPSAFPVQNTTETSVLKVLALSEGLAPFAAKNAFVYRQGATGQKEEITVPLSNIINRKSPDIVLLGGDILYIPDNRGQRLTASALEKLAGFGSATASGMLVWRR